MIEVITNPWPWYVAGPFIALTMFVLIWLGKNFGVSNNLRTLCAAGGGGFCSDFFSFNWYSQIWNLIFAFGSIIGGYIAFNYLTPDPHLLLSSNTLNELKTLGFENSEISFLPQEIFGPELNVFKIFILMIGGALVGFGARYAGGCTSGHAISGLSNLQLPSLIAVVGFFIGGLTMVHGIMPLIFHG